MTAPERDELLTVKEYAELYRVNIQTIYTAIRRGRFKLPIVRPTGGGAIRIAVPRENRDVNKNVE